MATHLDFSIRKGRTCSIEIPVTGVSDWTGLVAKLFAADEMEDSSLDIAITGTIDGPGNKITFSFDQAATENLTAQTSLRYEVALYKADGTYVKDTTYGLLNIAPVVKIDPTV